MVSVPRRVTHIGAAACVLGISLLGPQAGPAAADDGNSGSSAKPATENTANRTKTADTRKSARTAPGTPRLSNAGATGYPAASSPADTPSSGQPSPRRAAVSGAPNRAAAKARTDHRSLPVATARRGAQTATGTVAPVTGAGTAPASDLAPLRAARVSASANDSAVLGNATAQPAQSSSADAPCGSCWGLTAPTIEQGITTAINHLFNSAFNWLSGFPANPISDFVEGALVLIRRTLFSAVPTGVSATQTGTSLTIAVNTGSVAYFRNTGTTLEVAGDPSFSGLSSSRRPRSPMSSPTPTATATPDAPVSGSPLGRLTQSSEPPASIPCSSIPRLASCAASAPRGHRVHW
ncbi:hypothetical protein B1R94_14450 [Mycolicibacterium litorale]|nr:hypothetical protein B1R94_14450 [Mycolicibacterium litorale]